MDKKEKYDSTIDTMKHIGVVRNLLGKVCEKLHDRGLDHDQSKLSPPEKDIFDEYTPKLQGSTYGSDEYNLFLKEMQAGLDHHYFHNRHHPEFFMIGPEYNGGPVETILERMTLIDIIEMLMDWKAASMRHADGDILESIKINQKRFGYSDAWVKIFTNTIRELKLDTTDERHR